MTGEIEVSGIVRGLVDLGTEMVTYGPIRLTTVDGETRFACLLDAEGFDTTMIDRVCRAVESAVLTSTGAAVSADIQGYSYPNPQDPSLRTVVVQRASAGAATDSEEGVASRIDRRRLEQTVRDREDIEDVTKRYISRECRCLTNCVATSHANCRSLICDVIRQHQG